MIQKFRKFLRLRRLISKHSEVIFYGAPEFLKFLGAKSRALHKGFYSQAGQDALVFTEFFSILNAAAFPRIFVDVGCNHPVTHSNSYFFERNQGYSVLAVDALQEVRALWRQQRPSADFVECAVGETSGELSFDVVQGSNIDSMFSSVSGISHKATSPGISVRTVQVRRLEDVFSERGITCASIVSMDIEGYELPALKGINFDRFIAQVFIIENNSDDGLGSEELRDWMIGNGYLFFARIWNMDDVFIHRDFLSLSSGAAVPLAPVA